MKKVLIGLACITILASCNKSEDSASNLSKVTTQNPRGGFVQGAFYNIGDVVSYKGIFYECTKPTKSIPLEDSASWKTLAIKAVQWQAGTAYKAGDIVSYKGNEYKCILAHTSNNAWTPANVSSIWVLTEGNSTNDNSNTDTDSGSFSYEAWVSGNIYLEGDRVTHNNKKWLCRWYTKEEPGTTGQWGPWEEVKGDSSTDDNNNGGDTTVNGAIITSITSFDHKVDVSSPVSLKIGTKGSNISYTWTLLEKPAGSALNPASTSYALNFTPDKTGTYRFKVKASDGNITEEKEIKVEANRAIALVNGINYPGNDIKCEVDITNIRKILDPASFQVKELRSSQVVKNNIFDQLDKMSKLLEPGDIFVFYYSGHGSKISEKTTSTWGLPIDEEDGVDETLYMYNREHLIDDELDMYWKKFKAGVRIVTITDSCHSGTVYKSIARPAQLNIALSRSVKASSMQAELIHFSGCLDTEYSYGNNVTGGVFTNKLVDLVNSGQYSSYQSLYNAVQRSFAGDKQTPDFHKYNASVEFVNSRPFSR